MIKKIAFIISAALLAGCVSTENIKIDQKHATNMHEKTMAITSSDKPDFAAMTAGKAMFALVGAFAMISAGNDIVSENNISDPAAYIGEEVAKKLSSIHSVKAAYPANANSDDDISTLTKEHTANDYLLDVRTINWSFAYFPTSWDVYRVIYSAKLRIIDTKTQDVVAEGFCSRVPDQTADSPSYDELLNNNAARLKEELKVAADYCISEFQQNII